MPVFRVNKTKDYTIMSNTHFREKEMSLKAKGLLSMMLSLPDEWDYSIEGITQLNSDGKNSVMSAMKELERFGFLKRTRTKDSNGKFNDVVYEVYENATINPHSCFPHMGKPHAGKPHAGKPPQYNTNTLNTNELNTKEINNGDKPPNFDSEFESVWGMYPNKKGKDAAKKDFIKARKSGVPLEEIEKGIEAYAKYIKHEKTEQRFVKHGSTFFHQHSWEDSYEYKVKNDRYFRGEHEDIKDDEIYEVC